MSELVGADLFHKRYDVTGKDRAARVLDIAASVAAWQAKHVGKAFAMMLTADTGYLLDDVRDRFPGREVVVDKRAKGVHVGIREVA